MAISAAAAATSGCDAWPQSSSAWLEQPAGLIDAHRKVTSLFPGRATSCDTQGACASDAPDEVFLIDHQPWSSVDGSAAIADAPSIACETGAAACSETCNSGDQLELVPRMQLKIADRSATRHDRAGGTTVADF